MKTQLEAIAIAAEFETLAAYIEHLELVIEPFLRDSEMLATAKDVMVAVKILRAVDRLS